MVFLLEWNEHYSVGVEFIDEQHARLFELANEIETLLNNTLVLDKYDAIVSIITELKDYTEQHFADEEAYMLEKKFPKFLSHKARHLDFIEKVAAVDLGRIDDAQNEYLRDILRFVGTWLVEHILEEDKLYM